MDLPLYTVYTLKYGDSLITDADLTCFTAVLLTGFKTRSVNANINFVLNQNNSECIFEINLQGENVEDLEFPTFVLCKHKRRLFTNLTSLISVLYCTFLI